MNGKQETKGFRVVDHYDPRYVLEESGPKTVEVAVSLLDSLTIRDVFADEAKELLDIKGRLEKLHGMMVQRRAH